MASIAVIARGGNSLALSLTEALRQQNPLTQFDLVSPGSSVSRACDSAVYVPSLPDRNGMLPDLAEAERFVQQSAQLEGKKLAVISSALIYGTGPGRQSLVAEDYSAATGSSRRIAHQWKRLENLLCQSFTGRVRLTILRPVTVVPSHAL